MEFDRPMFSPQWDRAVGECQKKTKLDMAFELVHLRDKADSHRGDIRTVALLVSAFAIVIMLAFFRSHAIEIEPESSQVYLSTRSYWGIKRTRTPIQFLTAPGFDQPGWMAKNKDGSWRLALERRYDE